MSADVTVLVCTKDRPAQLVATLDALRLQTRPDFPIVVVDQSSTVDERLAERATDDPSLTVIRDAGRGLSRARNIGTRSIDSDWVAIVDDDCIVEPDWMANLHEAIEAHPEASFVSGHVGFGELPSPDYLPVTPSVIEQEQILSGRWTFPWKIGLGVCMAVRLDAVNRVGRWDERLGPGVPLFPAADDMDFNYRFLRDGGIAFVTPALRATHEQWRSVRELGPLFEGYMVAWTGFALKHVRTGDVRGGAWLWLWGLVDIARNLASAMRRRSRLRLAISWRKLRGLVVGTVRGVRADWRDAHSW